MRIPVFWDVPLNSWRFNIPRSLKGISRVGRSYDLSTLEDEGVRSQKIRIVKLNAVETTNLINLFLFPKKITQ
jgi:hypothetical protein